MATLEPYKLQVAKGQVEGATTIFVWGVNPQINGDTEETIMWTIDASRVLQPYPSSAQTMYLSSSSNNDDGDSGVQTGIRTLRVTGLDGDYNLVSEDITMQGRTQVATVNTYLRVFKMEALTVGSNGHQLGDIYLADSGVSSGVPTGTYYLRIDNSLQAPDNQSAAAIYTVPAGHTLYIDLIQFKTAIRASVTTRGLVNFVTRAYNSDAWVSLYKYSLRHALLDAPFSRPLAIPEKTDIECRGTIDGTGGNDVSAAFTGLLVKN
tara:strand:+ start:2884 stop:3675 length:792 start_codon:yes stop_codon:yes gene_type:complete